MHNKKMMIRRFFFSLLVFHSLAMLNEQESDAFISPYLDTSSHTLTFPQFLRLSQVDCFRHALPYMAPHVWLVYYSIYLGLLIFPMTRLSFLSYYFSQFVLPLAILCDMCDLLEN